MTSFKWNLLMLFFFDILNKNLALHNFKSTKFQLYSQIFVQFQRILQGTKMIFSNKNISSLEGWRRTDFFMRENYKDIKWAREGTQGWKSRRCATRDENVPSWVFKASMIYQKLHTLSIFSLTSLNFFGFSQWLKSTCDAQQELAWRAFIWWCEEIKLLRHRSRQSPWK